MSLEKYLKELAEGSKPPRHTSLAQLSGLSPAEIAEFKAVWVQLPQVRKCAILTRLAELGEENLELDFSAVYRISLEDGSEEVRERATRGLWDCDDRVIIRPLISLLRSDPSAKVRATAALSLGKFAELAQEGKLLARDAQKVKEALLSAISDGKEQLEVRRRAIEAIACFSSSEVREIIRAAYRSPDISLKQSAIFAMGRSSDGYWLPVVLGEIHHSSSAIRYEAATACGQLGDESVVPHLLGLVHDDDYEVQLSAVQALGAVGGPLAKRALIQCLKLGEDALEEAAEAALANIELVDDPLAFRFQDKANS